MTSELISFNYLRWHSSSAALGTRKPTRRGTNETPWGTYSAGFLFRQIEKTLFLKNSGHLMWEIGILLYLCHVHFLSTWYMWTRPEQLKIAPVVSSLLVQCAFVTDLKPIFLTKPRFTFFVIIFLTLAHWVSLVATRLLNICQQSRFHEAFRVIPESVVIIYLFWIKTNFNFQLYLF